MQIDAIEIETAPHPGASVIVLHGLGADGQDFVPIAEELDLAVVGPVRFVFPHAPVRPVSINGGYAMRAWYDIFPGDPFNRPEDEPGLRAAAALVEALIARENARGIPASRIVVAGFSQGCAVTLLAGVRHGQRLAGLAGLSGYLPLSSATAVERSAANQSVPIFLGHGRVDDVVAFERGMAARKTLADLGYEVEWHEYAMPHTVCPAEIADLNQWLLQVLAVADR